MSSNSSKYQKASFEYHKANYRLKLATLQQKSRSGTIKSKVKQNKYIKKDLKENAFKNIEEISVYFCREKLLVNKVNQFEKNQTYKKQNCGIF